MGGLFAPTFNRVPLIRKLQRFLAAFPEMTHCVLTKPFDESAAAAVVAASSESSEQLTAATILAASAGPSASSSEQSSTSPLSSSAASIAVAASESQTTIELQESGVWDAATTRGLQHLFNKVHRADQFEAAVAYFRRAKSQ
jgi:hypothetical protein